MLSVSALERDFVCEISICILDVRGMVAEAEIRMKKEKIGGVKAYVFVENLDRESRGLGLTLWEISRRFVENFANKWNISVKHEVNKRPGSGLSSQKWDELFLPILEKYGYIKKEASGVDFWEKNYLP